jgi:hypothetical protein
LLYMVYVYYLLLWIMMYVCIYICSL